MHFPSNIDCFNVFESMLICWCGARETFLIIISVKKFLLLKIFVETIIHILFKRLGLVRLKNNLSTDTSKVTVKTFIMLQKTCISNKCCSFELSVHQMIKKNVSCFSKNITQQKRFSSIRIIRAMLIIEQRISILEWFLKVHVTLKRILEIEMLKLNIKIIIFCFFLQCFTKLLYLLNYFSKLFKYIHIYIYIYILALDYKQLFSITRSPYDSCTIFQVFWNHKDYNWMTYLTQLLCGVKTQNIAH